MVPGRRDGEPLQLHASWRELAHDAVVVVDGNEEPSGARVPV